MTRTSKCFSGTERRRIARFLVEWFERNKRDLPWRRDPDPYHVFLSELLLQQTQVATALPYYERFLHAFPSFEALARAGEQSVLRAWAGLGYYRRARLLHAAARGIVETHGGHLPRDPEALRALPGVGRYTAGAVASIAFNLPEPALDGNVMRVLSRLLTLKEDPRRGSANKMLWDLAREMIPEGRARDFNQALMELGALVCLPRDPKCAKCPVREFCRARQSGDQTKYPLASPRAETVHERHASVLVRRGRRWLIAPVREGRRYAGFWEFPRFVFPKNIAATIARERAKWLRKEFAERFGLSPARVKFEGSVRHQVTHHRITLEVWRCDLIPKRANTSERKMKRSTASAKNVECAWEPMEKIKNFPLSSPQQQIASKFAT